MTTRVLLPILITLFVAALCWDLSRQAHRIADDWHRTADSVTAVATKAEASADRMEASVNGAAGKIDAIAGHVESATRNAGENVSKAVADAINPLPSFLKPQPTPNAHDRQIPAK